MPYACVERSVDFRGSLYHVRGGGNSLCKVGTDVPRTSLGHHRGTQRIGEKRTHNPGKELGPVRSPGKFCDFKALKVLEMAFPKHI